jgi:hypothetical protein
LGEKEKTRELSTMRLGNVTDLEVDRDVVRALNLPIPQSLRNNLRLLGRTPSDNAPVKLDAIGRRRWAGIGRWGNDAKRGKSWPYSGGIGICGRNSAFVCKMVQQTARTSIGSVDRAKETWASISTGNFRRALENSPQLSGSNLRTVVVFSWAKKEPLWTIRK